MKSGAHQSKLMRIIGMPIRILVKARDFYVNSMNNYAERTCYGGGSWGPSITDNELPRSFSTNSVRSSENDDFKELMRAASTRVLGDRIDLSGSLQPEKQGKVAAPPKKTVAVGLKGVPRSASVGMAKIDEDKPCEFEDADDCPVNSKKNKKNGGLFSRSRSHAVTTK
ncbi:hypothetical protein Nepgr_018312 [Nepenthes gracilis]|uniref:Uncharacterized protein n=1 Tax=Nepenthes gracilis TaxID=150966 RepID=A0AAD3XU70_NEPGR|nr:hypothetical protein Nepgr_018312 [Nepenthes gracilis]